MTVVEGEALLKKALHDFELNLDKAIDDAVLSTAIDVENDVVKSLNTQSKGKAYRKSNNVVHIASREGDAPNTDEGRLVGSITHVHSKGSKIAHVGTNVDYGAVLETEKNRPFLEPAKERQVKNFSKRMEQAVQSQVKKAGK